MSRFKSVLSVLLILSISFSLFGCASQPAPAPSAPSESAAPAAEPAAEPAADSGDKGTLMIKIGTGFPGGLWYPSSAILAASVETALSELGYKASSSIQSTASAFNATAVNEGKEMQVTLATSQSQYLAYNGIDPYTEPLKNLRLIGTQELMITQIVVPKNSPINSVSDLSNKVVNGGKPATTDRIMMEALFKAYDMTLDGIKATGGDVMSLGWEDAAALMQDGHMDCIGTFGGIMPSIVNLIVQPGVKFLSLDDAHVEKLLADPTMTGFIPAVLKAGTYDGQDEDVVTVAVPTTILCNKDLPDEVVYTLTKTIYESGYQKSPFASTEEKGWPQVCNPEDLPSVCNIPVHPGTAKYFEEIGIELPANATEAY